MNTQAETSLVSSVPILLNKLKYDPPNLPHEFIDLLENLREAILQSIPDSSWTSGAEHVVYLYENKWFSYQKRDILERRKDGLLCETITGCLFYVLSALVYVEALPGCPRVNLHRLRGSVYGTEVVCRPDGSIIIDGWSDELSLSQMLTMLYYINKRWFSYMSGHHEVIEELFPALLTRLLQLFEQPGPDDEEEAKEWENDLWMCEAHLRRLSWPATVRSHFRVTRLVDVPGFDEEMYLAILGAVNVWVEDIMMDQNAKTMSWFRQDVLEEWELPCIREIASRTLGTPRHMISAEVIKKHMPVDLRRSFLNEIATNSNQSEVYRSEPSQIRQGLIMKNVIENAMLQFDHDLSIVVKPRRHLWDISTIENIASSTHTYMLQMAGSYMTVWNGMSFVSRNIEEALAQMLYLEPDTNMMKLTLLALDAPLAQDDSSARLTHLHKSTMAITL